MESSESSVNITRRRLPHWTFEKSIYFVTWRLEKTQKQLSEDERDLVMLSLRNFDGQRYELFSFVIMNDHVHVLFRMNDNQTLPAILHSWKSFTANRMQRNFNRKGTIWQDEYFDRIIRNEKEFYNVVRYILNNPLKRWNREKYVWVWYKQE